MSDDRRTAGPDARPPWYVFVLAALGVLLVMTAIIGLGPHPSGALEPTPEPVPQPYRGPDTPTSTAAPGLGEATSVTVTTPVRRVVATTAVAAPPTTTTSPAPTVTTSQSVTIVLPQPGNPTYCCGGWYGGGWYGGSGGRHR